MDLTCIAGAEHDWCHKQTVTAGADSRFWKGGETIKVNSKCL